jgi:hypothetical protein
MPKERGVCKISAPYKISTLNPTHRPLPYLQTLNPTTELLSQDISKYFWFKTVKLTVHCSQTQYNGQKVSENGARPMKKWMTVAWALRFKLEKPV